MKIGLTVESWYLFWIAHVESHSRIVENDYLTVLPKPADVSVHSVRKLNPEYPRPAEKDTIVISLI